MRRQKSMASGPAFIFVGLALVAISLVVIAVSEVVGTDPAGGRAATLIAIGVPVGVLVSIAGVIVMIRSRQR